MINYRYDKEHGYIVEIPIAEYFKDKPIDYAYSVKINEFDIANLGLGQDSYKNIDITKCTHVATIGGFDINPYYRPLEYIKNQNFNILGTHPMTGCSFVFLQTGNNS